MKRSIPITLSFILLLFLLIGCPNTAISPGTESELDVERRITDIVTGDDWVHETGVLGPGAKYEIWVPTGWQLGHRGLVLWAHGYVNPSLPIRLPNDITPDMLAILMGKGFAIAQSSYSENGWAVKDGAIRTRQLRGYFAGAYGEPSKVLLVGASEGGIISIMLAEKNPELFDGALCIGGPIGGANREVKYIYDLRILFDCFFRDELAFVAGQTSGPLYPLASLADALIEALGISALDAHPTLSLESISEGAAFAEAVTPLIMALFSLSPITTTDPPGPNEALVLATMAVGDQADNLQPMFNWLHPPLPPGYSPPPQSVQLALTLATGLWYNIFGTEDILGRTHGHVPIDNTASIYVSMLVPGMPMPITGVERLSATEDATNYLKHWYQPTGRLRIPVVVMHTLLDPIVPVSHASAYEELVNKQGCGDFLLVNKINYFGHCQILMQLPIAPWIGPDDATFQYWLFEAFYDLLEEVGMLPPP